MIGHTINNYEIERALGDGGMGTVYYARHNRVDREVAIKVLHNNLFSNESIRNRFKNEANALIKLNHPNIVKIYDYVEQETFACLIMEYIKGYTLDEYITKVSGPLPSVKATSIICTVLEAVQYAHDNKIYHRDIKPGNIMIGQDGNTVKIMDFGIAKLTDNANMKTTHANAQLGTPFYMSPEQVKGLPFTALSDIYSLGVSLFEMVTGKCPYQEITNLFELQSKIVNEPFPTTHKYYPDVSLRLQKAIAIATSKDPGHRFQSCTDFKKYLDQKENLSISQPKPVSYIEKPRREEPAPPTKIGNKMVYGLVAAAILIFVVVVFLFVSKDNGSNAIRTIPVPPKAIKRIPINSDTIRLVQKEDLLQKKRDSTSKANETVKYRPKSIVTDIPKKAPCQTPPTKDDVIRFFMNKKIGGIQISEREQIIIQTIGTEAGSQVVIFRLLDENLENQESFTCTLRENSNCQIISYTPK